MTREMRGHAATVLLTLVAVAVLAALVIGGWQLGWWLKKETVNRNAKINRQSYEVQQTYREKVLDDISKMHDLDVQIADPAYAASVSQLRAARVAAIRATCDHISRLTTSGAGIDPDIQSFHDKECSA